MDPTFLHYMTDGLVVFGLVIGLIVAIVGLFGTIGYAIEDRLEHVGWFIALLVIGIFISCFMAALINYRNTLEVP